MTDNFSLIHARKGLLPYELGNELTNPYFHATCYANEGHKVYQAHGDVEIPSIKAAASCDLRIVRGWYDRDPNTDFRGRATTADSILAIRSCRAIDLVYCERDLGKLDHTRCVTRDSGDAFYLFARSTGPIEFALGADVCGRRLFVKDFFRFREVSTGRAGNGGDIATDAVLTSRLLD